MLIALFVCAQCYLRVPSAICVCIAIYVFTVLFVCLKFEPFSLYIFSRRPFMLLIRNVLACMYVFFTLTWRISALYIQYSLVKAKTVKPKTFQKLFHYWGRRLVVYCIEFAALPVLVACMKHNLLNLLGFIWVVGIKRYGYWMKNWLKMDLHIH